MNDHQMKALVKVKPEVGLVLKTVDKPSIQEDEVLIKTQAMAICGTDLHIESWNAWAKQTIQTPLIIGHEFMGEIAALGKNVTHLKVGQRVSGEGHITCGICRNCREEKQHLCPNTQSIGSQRNGAFAEFLSLPAKNVIPIPDSVSNDIGSVLDPLGNAVHTTLSFDLIGEDVFITGAGPIGLMASSLAKHIGARKIVVTDINDYRLNLARQLGATETIQIKEDSISKTLQMLKSTHEFTVGLEMSGQKSALTFLLENVCHGASIGLLGIPEKEFAIDWNKVIFKGLTLKGFFGRKMFETWDKMIHLLQSGLDISPIITHHFKIEEYKKAFELAHSGQAGKIILSW